MATVKTRSSVLAIRKETTEGTPVLVSGASDFIALQNGFSFAPDTEVLDSDELRSSIGKAKPRLGIERAGGSLSHYIRHSGVEGQAPNWGILLESALGGKLVQATQYSTTSGSSTTSLNVGSGIGANFSRGQALLIKDGVNGRSIRNLSSTPVGDALPLNFKLSSAPASGVQLGKNVGYYPVNSGHASLTCDLFRGNGGDREVIAGCKVEELTIKVEAGKFINGDFKLKGTKYHFDAIEIKSTNKYIDFNDGSDFSVSIPEKVYRDPHELASAIETALNDSASTVVFTCVYNDYGTNKGKFTITADSSVTIEWNTGSNTANTIGGTIGFITTSDDGPATSFISDNAQSWASPYSPSYDSEDAKVAKSCEVFLGNQVDNYNVCVRTMDLKLANDLQEKPCISSDTGIDGTEINGREFSVDMTFTLEQHDAREFAYYRQGDEIQFMFNFGEKSGGQWKEGRSMNVYSPTCTVSKFSIDDDNGDAVGKITLTGFVNSSGEPEVYINAL